MTSFALDTTRPTLNVSEVAALLGVSRWLVLQQVQQGNLPHKRFGRRIVISRRLLMAWLEDQTDTQPGPDPQPGPTAETTRPVPLAAR